MSTQAEEIKTLTRYPEFKAFENLLTQYLNEVKDVTNINSESNVDPGVQAMARKIAYETLTSFFEEINIIKPVDRTPLTERQIQEAKKWE